MAIFDIFSRSKDKNPLTRAIFEYWIHSGQVNQIPDDPDAYLKQGYSGNTTVYSIISRIDAMRKQAKLVLKDSAGNVIEKHDLLKFRDRFNKSLTTNDAITQILIYKLVIGEWFVYILSPDAGANKGRTIELHLLPANDVEIIEGSIFDPVRGYKIEGNYNIELPVESVYHGKMFNPNWNDERTLHGMSPLRAAANTVSKLNQIEITETKAFENQGPPYILYKESSGDAMQNRMTDQQRDEIVNKIKNAAKENNRKLPLVLKDKFGKLDLGQRIADMEIIESSNSGIISLCALYGLPPELMGYGQKTYNNMATARKSAWTDCIMPNLDSIAETMNACTIYDVPEYQGLKWDWDYSEVEELQEGMEIKVGWMKAAGYSYNEIRKATGKEPINNPLMDEPIVGMGDTFLSDYGDPLDDQSADKDFGDYMNIKK